MKKKTKICLIGHTSLSYHISRLNFYYVTLLWWQVNEDSTYSITCTNLSNFLEIE